MRLSLLELKKLFCSRAVLFTFFISLFLCFLGLLFLNARGEAAYQAELERTLQSERRLLKQQEELCKGFEEPPESERKLLSLLETEVNSLENGEMQEYLAASIERLTMLLEPENRLEQPSAFSKSDLEQELWQKTLMLQNKIAPVQSMEKLTLFHVLILLSRRLLPWVLPLLCVVLFQTYQAEQAGGTISLWFTRPYSRIRLCLSKCTAVFLAVLLFLLLAYGGGAILGFALGGPGSSKLLAWDSEVSRHVVISLSEWIIIDTATLFCRLFFFSAAALLLSGFSIHPVGYAVILLLLQYVPPVLFRFVPGFFPERLPLFAAAVLSGTVLLIVALHRYGKQDILLCAKEKC